MGIRGWAEKSIGEHEEIMDAIRERDARLTADRMKVHLHSSEAWQLTAGES